MGGVSRVLYPKSLEQALALLGDSTLEAAPLAGGTSLTQTGARKVTTLVDVTRLGFDYIRETDEGIAIGATTRVQSLVESKALYGVANGIVPAAAARVGSRLIRNAATVGGSVVMVSPWSDLPVVLLVLDGVVRLASDTPREMTFAEFLEKHPKTVLGQGELLTELVVAPTGDRYGAAFYEFARSEVDDGLVSAASSVKLAEDGSVADVRVALGAVRARPFRAAAAEEALAGGEPTAERIAAAAKAAAEAAKPTADARASREYRKHLVEVVVRRVLTESVEQAKEGN